jgi:hypothetical protein
VVREGSFAQSYLQALALKIYRYAPVNPGLGEVVERAWAKLSAPAGIPPSGLPDVTGLAFFHETNQYVTRLLSRIAAVRDALLAVANGAAMPGKVVSSRYTEGLPKLNTEDIRDLCRTLSVLLQGSEQAFEEPVAD